MIRLRVCLIRVPFSRDSRDFDSDGNLGLAGLELRLETAGEGSALTIEGLLRQPRRDARAAKPNPDHLGVIRVASSLNGVGSVVAALRMLRSGKWRVSRGVGREFAGP